MKRYNNYILVFVLVLNALGVLGQNTEKMTEPGNIILNLHAAPALTKISNSKYSNAVTPKVGFIGGFDAAYYFKTYKKVNIGVSLGLNYSLYGSDTKLNYNDSLWTTDADNENVHLFEKGNNLSETQKVSALDIPLLLHFDYPVAAKFDMYFNAGVYLSMLISKKYSTTADYTAKGYYPGYNATFFNVDVPASPYFYPTNKALSNDGELKLKSNIGVQLALGCKYSISSSIAITAGLNTYLGLKNISGYSAQAQPLVNTDRTVNSMSSYAQKVKTTAFALELGLSWNPAWLQKKK